MSLSGLTDDLKNLMEQVLSEYPGSPGNIVEIDAPRIGFRFSHAVGVSNRDTGIALSTDDPGRIASNTKTYVSAGILRLWEDGRLDLDASISRYLPEEHVEIMRVGGYDTEAITCRHLLTHTSGLFDYADCPPFIEAVLPGTHCWTRLEQLQGAMDWGDAYGAPGEVVRYSDTGFNELAEILEQVTGASSYGAAIRELADFDKLGLKATWLENFEPHPAGIPDRAHQYLDGVSNYDHDPSEDLHGGGGLIATVTDLMVFYRELFTGGIYKKPETVDEMLSTVMAERGGPVAYGSEQIPGQYRLGIFVQTIGGETCYKHGGYFGTEAAYLPDLDATVALGVNAAESDAETPLLEGIIGRLSAYANSNG